MPGIFTYRGKLRDGRLITISYIEKDVLKFYQQKEPGHQISVQILGGLFIEVLVPVGEIDFESLKKEE